MCPAAKFIKQEGIKKGEIFLGLLSRFSALFFIPSKPPIPEPIITPVLSESISLAGFHPESCIASFAAIRANWMKGSIFFSSFASITFSGKNSGFPSFGIWPPT